MTGAGVPAATGRVARLCRHPIKSHGREDLSRVDLTEGRGLPWDRHWAVAHEAARLSPGWNPCANFATATKAPALAAMTARLDEGSARVSLHHPDRPPFAFAPDDPAHLPAFLAWIGPLHPANRARPVALAKAGRAMTDTDYPSVSILNLASGEALGRAMGADLSPHRWRANLWVEGLDPWAERDWIGRRVRIGGAVLEVTEHIVRCRATEANPETGRLDAGTLAALRATQGHQEMGVYAVVVTGGRVAAGDGVVPL